MLTYLRLRASIAFKNFIHEEKGAADIVAVILVVVIAVAAAFLFREQIQELINNLFSNLDVDGLKSHMQKEP